MYNLNNEYVHLLRLYSSCYSNALFTRNRSVSKAYIGSIFFSGTPPDSILESAITNLTNYYDSQNDFDSKEIKTTYLQNKDLTGVAQQNYQLNFSNFHIATSTQFSTFIDFLISIEEGFSNNSNIPFFASNYNSILSIMPVYEQVLKFN